MKEALFWSQIRCKKLKITTFKRALTTSTTTIKLNFLVYELVKYLVLSSLLQLNSIVTKEKCIFSTIIKHIQVLLIPTRLIVVVILIIVLRVWRFCTRRTQTLCFINKNLPNTDKNSWFFLQQNIATLSYHSILVVYHIHKR